MATDLTRIGDKARQEPTLVFTTLYHHITDVDNLRACYDRLPAHKASGVDGVTKCSAPGFLDSGLTVFASTLPRPARRGRVAPGRGFDSRISPASTVRCMSA